METSIKDGSIRCYGYGIRTGPLEGQIMSINPIYRHKVTREDNTDVEYKFIQCITVEMQLDEGDSGAWIWSYDKNIDPKHLLVGMVSFKYTDNGVPYGILIPIWEIMNAFTERIVNGF